VNASSSSPLRCATAHASARTTFVFITPGWRHAQRLTDVLLMQTPDGVVDSKAVEAFDDERFLIVESAHFCPFSIDPQL